MNIQELIREIQATVNDAFAAVDPWFDRSADLQNYRPADRGWTVREILEHISLTSHFLLKLIDKGAAKALKNVNRLDLAQTLESYTFQREKLDAIGMHRSFAWIRPEHMEPTGTISLETIRTTLAEQKNRCLHYLEQLSQGEGALYKTTMTVNDLGKIDVYEYIYFLAKHAQRHVT